MAIPSGDRIIINPDYVHSVGVQVKKDAANLMDFRSARRAGFSEDTYSA